MIWQKVLQMEGSVIRSIGEGNRNLALAGTTSKAQRLRDKKPNTIQPHHYNAHVRKSILIMSTENKIGLAENQSC